VEGALLGDATRPIFTFAWFFCMASAPAAVQSWHEYSLGSVSDRERPEHCGGRGGRGCFGG